jgi:2-oxoglutarate ferredoxin oxidoreductase subunit delta
MNRGKNFYYNSKCKPGEKLHLHRSWCKACGICVAVCPNDGLVLDEQGYPYLKDPELCELCGLCEMHCPEFAIDLCSPEDFKKMKEKGESKDKEENSKDKKGKTKEKVTNKKAK